MGQADFITFLQIEYGRIGADTQITPREIIRDWIELLDILYQNPNRSVTELLSSEDFAFAQSAAEEENDAGAFAEFTI